MARQGWQGFSRFGKSGEEAQKLAHDSGSVQFFVMTGTNPGLDGSYTAWGRMKTGTETLDKLNNVRVIGEAPAEKQNIKKVHTLPDLSGDTSTEK